MPSNLILIGDGPERHTIEELCRKLGVCDNISFLGKLKETYRALSIADLFVLPSKTESFGLAALEAMASGVPVISSNAGGLPEVNIEGYTGYLSDVGDVDMLANNAIKVLKDPQLHATLKANAANHAATFDIAHVLPRYVALYNSVLSSKNN